MSKRNFKAYIENLMGFAVGNDESRALSYFAKYSLIYKVITVEIGFYDIVKGIEL